MIIWNLMFCFLNFKIFKSKQIVFIDIFDHPFFSWTPCILFKLVKWQLPKTMQVRVMLSPILITRSCFCQTNKNKQEKIEKKQRNIYRELSYFSIYISLACFGFVSIKTGKLIMNTNICFACLYASLFVFAQ